MNDFFDGNDHEKTENKQSDKQNVVYLLAFVGVLLLVVLIILGISESDKSKTRDAKIARKDPGKREYYKKRRPEKTNIDHRDRQKKTPKKRNTEPDKHARSNPGRQVCLSVVRVLTNQGAGSGTLISKKGYILTNEHVVRNSTHQEIRFSKDPKTSPQRYFVTQTVFKDKTLDVAVVKITRTFQGASLNHLTPARIGRSASLKIGDELIICGYPDIGGQTITLTRGVISGFLQKPSPWIKTDASISPGNSGGSAFTRSGDLVGVPTAGALDKTSSAKMGLVRPIDAIKKHISKYL